MNRYDMADWTIKVEVSRGVFSSERCVSFSVGDKHYESIVDVSDVIGDRLLVYEIERRGDEVLIQLPRECMVSGSRLTVPASMLEPVPEGPA